MNSIDLYKQAIKGDPESFLQILKMNEDIHYRIAYSFFRNEHDALDAIQEFTFKSLTKVHTVKNPEYLSTWLIRVLLNVCHDIKKKKIRVELKENIEEGEYFESINLELSEAIAKLPLNQQQLIYLKYYKDLKNEEIANEINVPEGTVKSRLHAAIKKLRVLFSEGGN
ncbi:RNA polymerase sigma (SigV) subunit OS=Ureibacillus acetophenoni OX=614649 GN=SAMN05877842_11916 PE=3 SV=1 [Ureibacillus acetophenoni]